MSLEGKTVLVTGANRGIGKALAAEALARGAARVYAGTRQPLTPTDPRVTPLTLDITDAAQIQAAAGQVESLDILINNAGIMRWAGLPDADAENLAAHLAVHVAGSFNTTRAAWPHMVEQGYGRVVMTTSTGMFGLPNNLSYATAKAAVIGLTRSLTTAGAEHDIKVNAIAPAAFTRMAGQAADDLPEATDMAPGVVAPMVAFLAHEDCPVSGEIYAAGAGRFARIFIAQTRGYVHPTAAPTVEDVAEHWATINDETGYSIPADLVSWSNAFMAHLSG